MKPLVKLLIVAMLVSITQAAVYYVDPAVPEGARGKAAGSISAPYGTIQQAADLVKADIRLAS